MRISEFDFDLPESLIAQEPADERSSSRMLHVKRASHSFHDDSFASFSRLIRSDDVLVVNNTKVFPARLFGKTDTGANIEIFLVREVGDDVWETLAKPAKRLKKGKRIVFDDDRLSAVSEGRTSEGKVLLAFQYDGDFDEIVDQLGSTPLPPYIKRESERGEDRERYQTVYASKRGAIAAPTAGLHFNDSILRELHEKGVKVVELTLHVGYGTFEPVRVDDVSEHRVSRESFEIESDVAKTLTEAKQSGRRVVAVGTTTTRALESAFNGTTFECGRMSTDLTITPGYEFSVVDALLTNFHLPKSSLLVLISSFAGYELTMSAYRHAVESKYRFYSYGDCMFIE